MYIINILLSAIIIIIGIVIGTQNGNTYIDVKMLWWNFDNMSLSLVMLESLVFGMLVVLIIAAVYEIMQRSRIWKMKRKIDELQKELQRLRNLVAEDVTEAAETAEVEEETADNNEGAVKGE